MSAKNWKLGYWPLSPLSLKNLKLAHPPSPHCQKYFFVALKLIKEKATLKQKVCISNWLTHMWSKRKKEKSQFRQKEESKLVILRENHEGLVNYAYSFRQSQKGQKMPDPPLSEKIRSRLTLLPILPPSWWLTSYVNGSIYEWQDFLY